jgi:hypothetical protein
MVGVGLWDNSLTGLRFAVRGGVRVMVVVGSGAWEHRLRPDSRELVTRSVG